MDCKQEFSIRYNHVGYGTGYPKVFWVAMPMGVQVREASFRILDAARKVALEGNLERRGDCGYTGETLFEGDFSAVAVLGKYRIAVFVVGVDGNKLYDAESFLFDITPIVLKYFFKKFVSNSSVLIL